jgi:hypothetical protein
MWVDSAHWPSPQCHWLAITCQLLASAELELGYCWHFCDVTWRDVTWRDVTWRDVTFKTGRTRNIREERQRRKKGYTDYLHALVNTLFTRSRYTCSCQHVSNSLHTLFRLFFTGIIHAQYSHTFCVNTFTPELNPSAQRCLTRFFTGDFASWTVHFINICVKNQQIHQLFIQFINYVYLLHVSALHCHLQGAFLVPSERFSIKAQSIEYCGWACCV